MALEIDPSLDYRHWRKDHVSVFPAIHSSYTNYSSRDDVDAALKAAGFSSFGAFNYLGDEGLFRYDAALFSGGGTELDIGKSQARYPAIWQRRDDTVLISDSGGFQVAQGQWTPKKYYENRERILAWQEAISDIAIAMDVPTFGVRNGNAVCIDSFDECLDWTKANFDWQVEHRNPKAARLLNVVQGITAEGHEGVLRWYDEIKGYCDRSKWGDNAFDGWSFGGLAAQNTPIALRVIARMFQDGLLGKDGNHRWLHILGVTKVERVASFTLIQRTLRKLLGDEDFVVSCDSSNATFNNTVGTYFGEGPNGMLMRKVMNASWFQPRCGHDCDEHYSEGSQECTICLLDRHLDVARAMGTSALAEHMTLEKYIGLVNTDAKGRLNAMGYTVFTFIGQEMFLRHVYGRSAEIVAEKIGLVDELVAAFKSETPDTALAKITLA